MSEADDQIARAMLTNKEADIFLHTSSNGRFVTDDPFVIDMGEQGLLYDYGAQALAGGAHYLVTTARGRASLNEWKAAQPLPPKSKRRCTEVFRRWQDYCDAFSNVPFSVFWKEIWPTYR